MGAVSPLFARQAYLLRPHHGYTDQQLAEVPEVHLITLCTSKEKRPEFRETIEAGQEECDRERVEAALLECATGFVRKQGTTQRTRRDGQEDAETMAAFGSV